MTASEETERGSGSEGDGVSGAMPNHCLCKLIIGGDSAEDALIFFRSNADPSMIDPKQPGLSFEEAVPYPEGTCRRSSSVTTGLPERPPTT